MPSDQLDPPLEATVRLFAVELEEFFLRYVFPKARRCSADIDAARSKIEELPEELQDQSRLARRLELEEFEGLEFLLDKVRRAARYFAVPRFSRFANSLEPDLVRTNVARTVVERLFPLIAQVFALFDVPERAETWSAEFELWLVRELQRMPDIQTVRSGSVTTGQNAVDQKTRQVGDHVASSQPPRSGKIIEFDSSGREEVETRARSRSQPPRDVDARKGMIARLKSRGVRKAKRIAVLMDGEIEKMTKNDQKRFEPLDEWKKLAPHLRTWKEFLDHKATHERVRNYINSVPPLPSEISKKSN